MLVRKGDIKMLQQMLDIHGVDLSTQGHLIFEAVDPTPESGEETDGEVVFKYSPSVAVTEFLLNNGCDVNARDHSGSSGLFIEIKVK
jgi:hypothetical protein